MKSQEDEEWPNFFSAHQWDAAMVKRIEGILAIEFKVDVDLGIVVRDRVLRAMRISRSMKWYT